MIEDHLKQSNPIHSQIQSKQIIKAGFKCNWIKMYCTSSNSILYKNMSAVELYSTYTIQFSTLWLNSLIDAIAFHWTQFIPMFQAKNSTNATAWIPCIHFPSILQLKIPQASNQCNGSQCNYHQNDDRHISSFRFHLIVSVASIPFKKRNKHRYNRK